MAVDNTAIGNPAVNVAKKIIITVGVIIFWLAVWHIIAVRVNKAVLLPTPVATFKRLFFLMGDAAYWFICLSSVGRILAGTLIGCAVGILTAALMLLSRVFKTVISPLMSAVRSVPVASFIIMALVWIDRGNVPAFISCLIVLPVICDAVYSGVMSRDPGLLEVTRVYGFTPLMRLTRLYIPSAVPYFLTALKTSVGMAWKSGVAAEVLCTAKNSIGGELYLSKVYMETEDLFAWTVTIIILSIIFEFLTVILVKKGLSRYKASEVIL